MFSWGCVFREVAEGGQGDGENPSLPIGDVMALLDDALDGGGDGCKQSEYGGFHFKFLVIIDTALRVETIIAVINATVCSHGLISDGTMFRNKLAIGAPIPKKNFVPKSVWSNGLIILG